MRDLLFYLAGLLTIPFLIVCLSILMGVIAKASDEEHI